MDNFAFSLVYNNLISKLLFFCYFLSLFWGKFWFVWNNFHFRNHLVFILVLEIFSFDLNISWFVFLSECKQKRNIKVQKTCSGNGLFVLCIEMIAVPRSSNWMILFFTGLWGTHTTQLDSNIRRKGTGGKLTV